MKRPKFRRFGFSTGAKVQQGNMRRLAKDMAKDPQMLIPECIEDCGRCQFDKLSLKLSKIQKFKDNLGILNKLARGGRQLERGYAAMLILAAEEGSIAFATAKLPSGDVNYTMRGKVKKEVLIGLEHFDDVELSLLAYSEIAVRKGLHIYSSIDGVFCSGAGPRYPAKLMSEVLKSTNYSLKKTGNDFICEHLAEGGRHGEVLNVEVLSAESTISLCATCASKKRNIYTELTKRVMTKRPERDIRVDLEHRMDCVNGDDCSVASMQFDTRVMEDRYRKGALSDEGLLEEFGKVVRTGLNSMSERILVIGERCFEGDAKAFIDALRPSNIERKALEHVIASTSGPVVVDSHTSSAVLSLFWESKGIGAIKAVTGDGELAKKIFAGTRGSDKTPSQILREAETQNRSQTALAALPELRGLAKIGRFADEVAREYKALGRDEALRVIDRAPKNETKLKSVSCGLLLALDALKGKEWQFTKEELDYGRYLADFSKALLGSEPDDYKEALQNLLTASGSGETLE